MNCSCKLASLCCFLLVPLAASFSRAANDDAPAADKSLPGLIARFREPKVEWEIDRIDAVPRLFGKATDAAHYALPATGGLVSWTGLLVVPSDGQFVFTARTNSLDSLSIRINGKSATLGQPIALQAGLAPLEIEGTQKKAGPIGLELWWRGPGFDDEPIAPRFFRHNAPARKTRRRARQTWRAVGSWSGSGRSLRLLWLPRWSEGLDRVDGRRPAGERGIAAGTAAERCRQPTATAMDSSAAYGAATRGRQPYASPV